MAQRSTSPVWFCLQENFVNFLKRLEVSRMLGIQRTKLKSMKKWGFFEFPHKRNCPERILSSKIIESFILSMASIFFRTFFYWYKRTNIWAILLFRRGMKKQYKYLWNQDYEHVHYISRFHIFHQQWLFIATYFNLFRTGNKLLLACSMFFPECIPRCMFFAWR